MKPKIPESRKCLKEIGCSPVKNQILIHSDGIFFFSFGAYGTRIRTDPWESLNGFSIQWGEPARGGERGVPLLAPENPKNPHFFIMGIFTYTFVLLCLEDFVLSWDFSENISILIIAFVSILNLQWDPSPLVLIIYKHTHSFFG